MAERDINRIMKEEKESHLICDIVKAKYIASNASPTLELIPSIYQSKRKQSDNKNNLFKKQRIVLTDRILDEAANEVAEELEWDQIMKEWDTQCENIPYLITF
jgi:hypothetical protein